MNTIALLKKLISIPSFVDGTNNEAETGEFLMKYIKSRLPNFWIKTQKLNKNRFNIISGNSQNPKIIFISHMDTVKPNSKTQLVPRISGNKIFGLGAVDMKGGLAASLSAVITKCVNKQIAMIFDCDEEYYFKGIKRIIKEFKFKPNIAIFPEPTDLQIVNGCRGVVEIEFEVIGKTAHGGTPQNGVNAIEKSVELVEFLKKELIKKDKSFCGKTTVNFSNIKGGRLINNKITKQANAVPDIAKVLLDIRTAGKHDSNQIKSIINRIAKVMSIKILNYQTNLDYEGYLTQKTQLKLFERSVKAVVKKTRCKYLNLSGFSEAALVSNAWNCPCINFGPRTGKTAHTKDEYVDISSLKKTQLVYENFINNYKF